MAKNKKEEKVKRHWGSKVPTSLVRTSYSYITKPDEGRDESDDKYKFTAMKPKSEAEELKPLKLEMLKVAREAFGKDTKFKDIETPFKDGDEHEKEEYNDHIVFNVKSRRKPGVIVGKKKTKYSELSEEEQKEIALDNAGYYVIAMCVPSSYVRTVEVIKEDANGKEKTIKRKVKGVNINLESLWYVKDGERFGGTSNASADFADIDVDEDTVFDDDEELGGESEAGEEVEGEEPFDDDDDLL